MRILFIALVIFALSFPAAASDGDKASEQTGVVLNNDQQEILEDFNLTHFAECQTSKNQHTCFYVEDNMDIENNAATRYLAFTSIDTSVLGKKAPKKLSSAIELFEKIQQRNNVPTQIKNDEQFFSFYYEVQGEFVHGIGWLGNNKSLKSVEVLSQNKQLERQTIETWDAIKAKIKSGDLRL